MVSADRYHHNLRQVLRDHWITGIVCDHEAKTDRATCSCSLWYCEPQDCVGDAVDSWIDHIQDQLELLSEKQGAD